MLELQSVCKTFNRIEAVDHVSFSARAGEITGYLGPNGSGKSTTMKMLAGLMQPTSGTILFNGQPVTADLNKHKERMGYVPEESHLYGHLSGLEYLIMVGQLKSAFEAGSRSHQRAAAALFSARRPACADLQLLQGNEAEGSAVGSLAAQS